MSLTAPTSMTTLASNTAFFTDEAIEVRTNEVQFMRFTGNHIRGIGMQYLNLHGSTVIVMVSPSAALVANVPHLPFGSIHARN